MVKRADSSRTLFTLFVTSVSVFMVRCICGLLKNKCRILVTHQLQHLKLADQILVLQEVCAHAFCLLF